MLRKPLIGLLIASLAILALAPGAAQAFSPATQSHEGACARETTNVAQAVHDYVANGVLADFAHLVGLHGSPRALEHAMRTQLVVARIQRRVVTANHGCDGEGHWFAVGPRTLHAGEQAGVRVPAKLRARLCLRSHRDCRRIVLKESVVFPITCWNPNFGHVDVVLYVRKPKSRHHVQAAKEQAPPAPAPAPTPPPVDVLPTATPVADPSATAVQAACSAGAGVVVTLSNGASATASASFVVNEATHGPIAAGQSEELKFPLAPGEHLTVTVVSGSTTLIPAETFTNGCVAKPFASAELKAQCVEGQYFEYEIKLGNEAAATLPASFKVEWDGPEQKLDSQEFASVAPGQTETLKILVGFPPEPPGGFTEPPAPEFTVTSGGVRILHETAEGGC
jgi:hypothetical protein